MGMPLVVGQDRWPSDNTMNLTPAPLRSAVADYRERSAADSKGEPSFQGEGCVEENPDECPPDLP